MKINLKILKEKDACKPGLDWFQKNYGDDDVDVDEVLAELEKQKVNYQSWLMTTFKLTAICKGWYESGEIKYEGNFKNGKRGGFYREWYENGQIIYEGNYGNGKAEGICKGWYKDGQIEYEGNYKNDKLIS